MADLPTAERCRELAKEHDDTIADCLARGSSAAFVQTGVDAAAVLRWAAEVLEGMGRAGAAPRETPERVAWLHICDSPSWMPRERHMIESLAALVTAERKAAEGQLAARQAEVLGLREALRRYGVHPYSCGWWRTTESTGCNCGLAAALKDPAGVTPAARAALEGK